jgi:lauroyl/myristoyl acyltransferase
MKYRPAHVIEYILLRIVAFILCILPHRAALAFGWMIAAVAYHGFGFRRAETLRRMRIVFGNKFTDTQYRRMAWVSARNTVFNTVETLRIPRTTREWCNHIFDYAEAMKLVKDYTRESGKGCIIALPHMGNWDLAGIAYALNDIPIFVITAKQKNPLVSKYFDDARARSGMVTYSRGEQSDLREMAKHLRRGGVLAILPDARMRTPGIKMPLLGGTANLGTGMGIFARMASVPIFPIIITRKGWTKHHIRPFPALEPDMTLDKKEDVRRMTAFVMNIFDREIQAAPEQWFWINSRWVLDPVKASRKDSYDSDQ